MLKASYLGYESIYYQYSIFYRHLESELNRLKFKDPLRTCCIENKDIFYTETGKLNKYIPAKVKCIFTLSVQQIIMIIIILSYLVKHFILNLALYM